MTVNLEFYQGKGFTAKVIRTNRQKTATVKVEEGMVSVVVPDDLSDARIEEVVRKKTRWVREKLLLQRQHNQIKPKEYVSGECFTYLGKNYRLKVDVVTYRSEESVKLIRGRLVVSLTKGDDNCDLIRANLEQWYKFHAEQKLQDKVHRYADIIGVSPKSVGIRTFKSRWGSCSTNGDVTFNWKIIIASNRIVDYVVVHELCHMKHHDHSAAFWNSVEKVIPDYQACKEWLKENGNRLQA
jgi:predicted metal-dependent hydrolase